MNDYIVYCLYTEIEGVFYIGHGRVAHNGIHSRLGGTVSECNEGWTKTLNTCMKCKYIRACRDHRIKVYSEVIYRGSSKQVAEEVEYALIRMYPGVLCNVRGVPREHIMRELPAFLIAA